VGVGGGGGGGGGGGVRNIGIAISFLQERLISKSIKIRFLQPRFSS